MTAYDMRISDWSSDVCSADLLVFHDGIDLPCFASCDLLKDEAGRRHVYAYYARYAAMARDAGLGFVLESPTWRANADWPAQRGYDEAALAEVNRTAISVMAEVRAAPEPPASPMVISGNITTENHPSELQYRMRNH